MNSQPADPHVANPQAADPQAADSDASGSDAVDRPAEPPAAHVARRVNDRRSATETTRRTLPPSRPKIR